MSDLKQSKPQVQVLKDSVARKIAAGEVIDRPFAVVRELLDNSIDAGADQIALYLEGGGIDLVRVVDNGRGMSKEDLQLCYLPHATSKIITEQDLDTITSLGFRGEALGSIAASARLEIISRREEDSTAHRLIVQNGKVRALEPCRGSVGTIVESKDLFAGIPGRRKFLKSTGGETSACRTTFIEKALPFPDLSFRLFTGSELKLFLPPATIQERVAAAYPQIEHPLLHTFNGAGPGFSFTAVAGGPSLFRRDRRYIHIYVNNRKVNEYSLVQAVEYAYGHLLPGGVYPVAFLFLNINPSEADFNIHPAKREVRFKDKKVIHHGVVEELKRNLSRFSRQFTPGAAEPNASQTPLPRDTPWLYEPRELHTAQKYGEKTGTGLPRSFNITAERRFMRNHEDNQLPAAEIRERADKNRSETPDSFPPGSGTSFLYLGQIFHLFLLAQTDNRLFIIDQHAAHERILYDRFRSRSNTPQPLLIPRELQVEPDDEPRLQKLTPALEELGIRIEKEQEFWYLKAVPEYAGEMVTAIEEFLLESGTTDELQQKLYADLACKAAVKDGETLDETSACELIHQTFSLPEARCPHGRPVWYELSKEELFILLGRT